jgi:hypothetical protein
MCPAGREDVPHAAVLWVRFEVHEVLPDGQLRGSPVATGEKVYKIEGPDRQLCLCRLEEALGGLKGEQAATPRR